ncbi:MAG: POTRA domain-containing protein [Chitinophagales bacterium]|nr:POTRA domain-containing protein [Chitinophagales bacterium]
MNKFRKAALRVSFILCGIFFFANSSYAQKQANYAAPGDYGIGGITVSGTQYLDQDILISLTGLRVGQKISIPGDAISNAIKNLWDQGFFTDVKVYITKTIGSTAFLEIAVKERPRLSRFTLNGIKKGEADDIREKIKLTKGRVVNENMKLTTANTIKNFYKEKGYLNSVITIREKQDTLLSNSVMLDIDINKGAKVKIESINIAGTEIISRKKIKKLMKETHEKVKFDVKGMLDKENIKGAIPDSVSALDIAGNFAPSRAYKYTTDYTNLNIFKGSKFLRKEYENDKDNIIAYYNEKGYRDAYIAHDSVYMHGKNLRIDLVIDEGNQYYFRNITWTGNTKYPSLMLDAILNIKKGEVYNQKLLDERLFMSQNGNDVSSLYMDDGYLFFQITPAEITVENDSIDIEIRIYEGPQATINEIRIYGNTKTKEHVIRRELRTLPGNKFSRSDLIRSQREIVNLGYFDPEQLQVIPIPDPAKGTVDIEYHVVEKPSDQLELSAGWGGRGRGIVGSLGITFTNFSIQNIFKKGTWSPLPSGDGQRLSLRVQTNGKVYQAYNMSFTEPWLGGKKPNSFTLSYYHTRFADLNSNRQIDGQQITNGASIGFGMRLKKPDDWFTLQYGLTYERFDLRDWASSNFILDDGVSNNLSANVTFGRFSARSDVSQIFPTTGSNISISLSITPPYSLFRGGNFLSNSLETITDEEKYKWIEYHKWRFNAEWFLPLTRSKKFPLVLRFSAKFGFLGKYNDKIGYSPYERFEVGGDGISNVQFYGRDIISLRGYEVAEVTPSGAGAPFFNKLTMELRFPFSLNPSATIYGLAFMEGGNTWMDIKDFNPFDMKRAAGLGVRIFLPMFGMLGFDYGIGFDKNAPKGSSAGDYLSNYGKFSIILGFEPE